MNGRSEPRTVRRVERARLVWGFRMTGMTFQAIADKLLADRPDLCPKSYDGTTASDDARRHMQLYVSSLAETCEERRQIVDARLLGLLAAHAPHAEDPSSKTCVQSAAIVLRVLDSFRGMYGLDVAAKPKEMRLTGKDGGPVQIANLADLVRLVEATEKETGRPALPGVHLGQWAPPAAKDPIDVKAQASE